MRTEAFVLVGGPQNKAYLVWTMVQSVLACFSAAVTKSAVEKEGFSSSYSPALRQVREGAWGRNLAVARAAKAREGPGFLTCLRVHMQHYVLYNPGAHSQGSAHLQESPLPSMSNRENAPHVCPYTNMMGPVPQLRFPLPKCLQFLPSQQRLVSPVLTERISFFVYLFSPKTKSY